MAWKEGRCHAILGILHFEPKNRQIKTKIGQQ